ncbi:WYL domain-containing protein [Peptoniphilaceae bacterium SGI.137]
MGKNNNVFLSNLEVNDLIAKVRVEDNAAWQKLYENFRRYVHKRCWQKLSEFNMSDAKKKDMEEDLYIAGWAGFIDALRHFDPERGGFLTYATPYIDGEISKELGILLNPLGLTGRKVKKNKQSEQHPINRVSLEKMPEVELIKRKEESDSHARKDSTNRGKYNAERRVLQILDILKRVTDENNSISKEELVNMLKVYRVAKYDNATPVESLNTITSTLESILLELNPPEYNENKDIEYRVKYNGYKEDRLKKKLNKEYSGKAPEITGFSFVHLFTNLQLDQLIGLVSFSDILTTDEKAELISKLVETASVNYRTPFWDGEKLKFNPKAVHSRLTTRENKVGRTLAENVKILQYAINNLGQIQFRFNRYGDDKKMAPSSKYVHKLSPYHLVVYHDNYYCIGLKVEDKRIWHYRLDLMSDIEIIKDEEGKIIPIELSDFEGLPLFNASWDPEKYMSEHLYMAYDELQDIKIKIRNTDFTIIHDWFGDHYDKVYEMIEKDDKENEIVYSVVKVRTSPSMIVHWAMQYGTKVEIMDEEIREAICNNIRSLERLYEA